MSKITKYFPYISNIKSLLSQDSSSCSDNDVEFFNISYLKSFLYFIEKDSTIQKFLEADKCKLLADKYLIALTFAYFVRAGIPIVQFDTLTFFAALHIAHDMEEDDLLLKRNLCNWTSHSWEDDEKFYEKRRKFLEMINFRAVVSQEMCDKIMNMEETKENLLWKRERSVSHAGALKKRYRGHDTCNNCRDDKIQDRIRRYYQPFGDGYLTMSESGSNYDEDESSCDSIQTESHVNNEINQEKQEKQSPDVNTADKCSPIIPDYSESLLFPDNSVRISSENSKSSEKRIQPVPTVIPNNSCVEPKMLANESCNIITPVDESSTYTAADNKICNITTGGKEKDYIITSINEKPKITGGTNEKCKITTEGNEKVSTEKCKITSGTNKTWADTSLCQVMINTPEIDDHIIVVDLTSKEKNNNEITQDNVESKNHMMEHDKKKTFEEMLIELEKSLEEMDTKNKQLKKLFETKKSPDLIFSNAICTNRSTTTKEKESTQHHKEQEEVNELEINTVKRDYPNHIQETREPIELMDGNVNKPVVNDDLMVEEGLKKINIHKAQRNRKMTVPENQLPSWKGLHRKVDNIVENFDNLLLDNSNTQESTPIKFGPNMENYKLKTDLQLDHCKHQMIVEHYKTQNPKVQIRYPKVQLERELNYELNTSKINVRSSNLNLKNGESQKLKGNVSKHTFKPESLENKHFNKKRKFPIDNSMHQKNQPDLEYESEKILTENGDKEDIKVEKSLEVDLECTNDKAGTLLDFQGKCYKSKGLLTPDRTKTSNKTKSANKLKDFINKIKMFTQKNNIQQNVKNITYRENSTTIVGKENDFSKNIPIARKETSSKKVVTTSTSCSTDVMVQCSNIPSNINFETREGPETKMQTETTSGSSSSVDIHEKSTKILKIQKLIPTNITNLTRPTNIKSIKTNGDHSKAKVFMKAIHKCQNKLIQNQHSEDQLEFVKFPALSKECRMQLIPSTLPSLVEMKQEQTRISERMQKKFGTQTVAFKEKDTNVKKPEKLSNSVRQSDNCYLDRDKGLLTNKDENKNQFEKLNFGLDENNNELNNDVVTIRHVSAHADTQHDSLTTDGECVKSKLIIPITEHVTEKSKCNTKETNISSAEKILTNAQIYSTTKNKMLESKDIAPIIRDGTRKSQCKTKGINSHSTLVEPKTKSTINRDVLLNYREIYESTGKSIKKSQEFETCLKPSIRNYYENYQFNKEKNDSDLTEKSSSKSKALETFTSEPKNTELVLFDMTNTAIAPLRTAMSGLVQSISQMTNEMKILGNKIEAIESHIPNKRKAQSEEDLNPTKIKRYEKSAEQFSGYKNMCITENTQDDDIVIIKENIVTRYNVQMVRCSNTEQLGNTSFPTFITDKPIKTEKKSENFGSGKGKVKEVNSLDVSQTLPKQSRLMEHTTSKCSHETQKKFLNTTQISIGIHENPASKEKYLNLKIRRIKKK